MSDPWLGKREVDGQRVEVLEGGGKCLPVRYAECILPDPLMTHADGVDVLVDELHVGPSSSRARSLRGSSRFLANETRATAEGDG